MIVQKLFQIWLNMIELMFFPTIFLMFPQLYNAFKYYEKKNFDIFMIMKSMSKNQNLAITFWAILLIIKFEDLILIFYIWVPNTKIEGAI